MVGDFGAEFGDAVMKLSGPAPLQQIAGALLRHQ